MPVTARLSRKFYDKLGEDIAQEFVDWFNMVDATYREDLRETNELNFARFDAKLEQRTVELGTRIDTFAADLNSKIDQHTAALDAKIDQLDAKIDQRTAELEAKIDQLDVKIDQRTAELDAKIDKLDVKIDQRTAELDAKIDQRTTELDGKIDKLTVELGDVRKDIRGVEKQIAAARADVIKWSFVFWVTTALIVFGLASRLL